MWRTEGQKKVDNRIFITICWLFSLWLAFDYGLATGKGEPRQCAVVPGKQVVSSTAETCTYASAFGRATNKRRTTNEQTERHDRGAGDKHEP